MLALLRLLFTGLFCWLLWTAASQARADLNNDAVNAGRFALAILAGFAAAVCWAPLLGSAVAGPLTGTMTDGSAAQSHGGLVRWAQRCEARKWRRLALFFCLCDGVRRPHLPAAFVIGMNNARPGTWLQGVFAREVWRFSNVANCLRAHAILTGEHGVKPGRHPSPEVNLALMAHVRPERPPVEVLAVPQAPAPVLARNPRIRLFAAAEDSPPAPPAPR